MQRLTGLREFAPGVAVAAGLFVACGSSSSARSVTDAGHRPDVGADAAAVVGCTTTAGTSGTLLRGTLLLPSGPAPGELLISTAGLITCAASSCSATTGYSAATVIDCPTSVISPALINPHDHTDYATVGPGPEAHGDTRYDYRLDWLRGADDTTPLPYVKSTTDVPTIAAQELRLVLGGATSVIGTGGVNGLARNLAAYSSTTGSVEGLSGNTVYFDTFPLDNDASTVVTSGCAYPSIETLAAAFEYGGRYVPHIAEGVSLGAENEVTCTSLSTNNLLTPKTSVIHGVAMNATDVAKLQAGGSLLIWSPRSNISLYGDTAPITELRYANITIALGTDWLPSGSMSMLRELACADFVNQKYFDGTFSDQDLFLMATINGAIAAGFDNQIGSLAMGKQADVTIFDATMNHGYRAVIAASSEDVRLVLRGGKVLYGDANVVGALASSGCAALSVCGIDRSVCIDTPGVTLGDLQAIGTSIYPLFPCRTAAPASEPTCAPYRDTYPSGTSATDYDGDGIDDSSDDCPKIFNPVRPMDGTKQADVDGDGLGDACDAFPLDPTKH